MLLTATASRETIPAGIYKATLKDMILQESTNPDFGGDHYLMWIFDVTKGGKTKEVAGTSSTSFGNKAKARGWAEALVGRKIKDGEEFDTDELIGKTCQLVVILEDRDDGSKRNKITELVALADDGDEAF